MNLTAKSILGILEVSLSYGIAIDIYSTISLANASYDIMHYSIKLVISIVTYDKFYLDLPITMISSGFNQLWFHLKLHTMPEQVDILICKHQALQIVCCAYVIIIHSVMIQY